jgi:hypothetical protein
VFGEQFASGPNWVSVIHAWRIHLYAPLAESLQYQITKDATRRRRAAIIILAESTLRPLHILALQRT